MLSDRRQRVLAALIEEYVERAMPVGSRTLTENYRFGVSSATIRNELSALEEEGYISQPHTSAGRIPTDFGYRTFVDSLLESKEAPVASADVSAIENLKATANELDDLLRCEILPAEHFVRNCRSGQVQQLCQRSICELTFVHFH